MPLNVDWRRLVPWQRRPWRRLGLATLSVLLLLLAKRYRTPVLETLQVGGTLVLGAVLADVMQLPARLRCFRRRVPTWVFMLLVVVMAAVLYPRVMLRLETVMGWDCPIHVWHSHVLATELFPALRGWTWMQAFGWPEGDVYALLPHLPPALLHRLTFGLVPIEPVMALEMAAVVVALPWVMWRWFSPEVGAWTALGGVLMILVDPGQYHEGGSIPLFIAGMWPVRFSFVLGLCALVSFDRYLAAPQWTTLLWAWIFSALACLSHVAGITYFAFGVALLLLARPWRKDEARVVWHVVVACMSAMLITGWMVLPFWDLREYVTEIGETRDHGKTLISQLFALNKHGRMSALELALGLGGALWLVSRTRLLGRYTLLAFACGSVLLGTDVLLEVLPVRHHETVMRFQFPRYEMFGRNAILFCAGCVLFTLGAVVVKRWMRPTTSVPMLVFGCMLTGYLVGTWNRTGDEAYFKSSLWRARGVETAGHLPFVKGLQEAGQWLKQNAQADTLAAVDYPLLDNGRSPHVAGYVQMSSGLPVMAVHRQGTFEFRDRGPRDGQYSFEEMAASGATHWVSVGEPGKGRERLAEMQRFTGDVRVHALPRVMNDQRLNAPEGVTIQEWSRERLVITGPTTGWEMVLRARWNPRWKVVEGQGVQVAVRPFLPGSRPIFIGLQVPAGVDKVVLEYASPERGFQGGIMSILGLLIGVALVLFVRARSRVAPMADPEPRT